MIEDNYKLHQEKWGEFCGYACDGPLDSSFWFSPESKGPKILFLLKETYGFEDDPVCCIMDNLEERFNDSKTNRAIAKMSSILQSVFSDPGFKSLDTRVDGLIFDYLDNILDSDRGSNIALLKESFSKVAIIECKKTSGVNKSNDGEILQHAIDNSEYLSDQISYLNPDIIFCGGQIIFEIISTHLKVFEVGALPDNKRGVYKIGNKFVINAYHPSYSKFSTSSYDYIFDIIKNK